MSDQGRMNVFLVGNNPTEIRDWHSSISKLEGPRFNLEVAFNLRQLFRRIKKFKPVSILIDDRLNRKKLRRLIKRLHRNAHTHHIPVTLMKSSNREFQIDAEIDDYVLKENLSAERLRKSILNSRRLRKTSIYLFKSYKRSRGIFQKIWLELTHRY